MSTMQETMVPVDAIVGHIPPTRVVTAAAGRQYGRVRVWDMGRLAIVAWQTMSGDTGCEIVRAQELNWDNDDELLRAYLLTLDAGPVELGNVLGEAPTEVPADYQGPVRIVVRRCYYGGAVEYRYYSDDPHRGDPREYDSRADAAAVVDELDARIYEFAPGECTRPAYYIVPAR